MEESSSSFFPEPNAAEAAAPHVEVDGGQEDEHDPESNSLQQPLLKRSPTLTASHYAMVGAKVSHIESLDYEINENDLFKHDWRSRSSNEVLQYIFLKWTLAFLVGLLTGVTASLINLAIENIAGFKMLYLARLVKDQRRFCSSGSCRYITGFAYLAGVNLALTTVAATLCVMFAPTAAGPGIPEIKAYLNGVDTPNMFGASTLIVKIIGSIGSVSAGLDLGKEGPLVHIGSCFASLLGQGGSKKYRLDWKWLRYFKNDRDRRDLITCGASSGVCAAFRSPVGGVLFALEEVATWWRSALLWRTFFSTAVVVVVLRGFIEYCNSGRCGLFGRGGLILFDVSEVAVSYHINDLLPVAVVGVIGGLLGSLYNYVLHKVLRLYSLINERGRVAKLLLSLGVSIFTSICLYCLPFLVPCTPCDPSLGAVCPTPEGSGNFKQFNCPNGYYNDLASLLHATNDDAVRNVFSTSTPNEFRAISLLIFFALYCVLGLVTFGIAVPSGLFLPIILMGSAYGRLLALALKSYVHIDQGLYAVLGAAALMSGSMRMTVSLCVIFLELTNNLLLLPITMFVLLIAKTVGDSFNPSIYEIILELKGLPFLEAKTEPWMRNLTVGELAAAKPSVVNLRGVEKVSRVVEVLKQTSHNGFPVVDQGGPSPMGTPANTTEIHGLVLRAHLVAVLRKKWFLKERRRTADWEVREKFTSVDLAEKGHKVGQVLITEEEMNMYIDLHPFTNTTPYTVVESMSVAKAVVLFRQVGLRHLLIIPKYQGAGISPVVGILTRQDLIAHNILNAFPHLANKKGEKGRNSHS
ncbi:chloride channel protein CLC-a-like [Canna indica]|uniref:Chloride channel protein n=1 Tax=Canna indica TaxID=4628 RepID=A0AAQ3K3T3_9LILI|nr:chloride channel protein CLC-a-like [Canna indica]